ncbi:MAG TPA: hypothetical protein VK824_12715 [Planctomycetota bacterium]|nr:hypothetical protein [Planctomycetota bacterium]
MGIHSGKETALELLLEQPARLENGLVALDRRLPLDESVEVDALLRDSLGYPVVVLFSKGEISQELGRMAAVVAGLQRGRYLLSRLYGDKGLDASLRPRFVLLGARFADDASALLDMMAGVEVHALEYRVVTDSNGQQVLDLASFHRTSGPSALKGAWRGGELSAASAVAAASGARSGAPAAASPPAGPAAAPAISGTPTPTPTLGAVEAPAAAEAAESPAARLTATSEHPRVDLATGGGGHARTDRSRFAGQDEIDARQLPDVARDDADLARGYFMRARDSIRSLSIHVSENSDRGALRYRVADADLATLSLDARGFHVQVGAAGGTDGAAVTVSDEAGFNERLNAVFTLYFNRLGPDRPTA